MLSPRVVEPGIPGHLTVFPFLWVGNNKRFDVTQDPEDGGVWWDLARAWNLTWNITQSSLGLLFLEVPYAHTSSLLIHWLNSIKRFLILGEMALYKVLDITRQKKKKTLGVTRKCYIILNQTKCTLGKGYLTSAFSPWVKNVTWKWPKMTNPPVTLPWDFTLPLVNRPLS